MRERTIVILSLLLTLSACSREPVSRSEAVVKITTSINPEVVATKDLIYGTSFPRGYSYGIFISEHESTTAAHKSNSWNIRASLGNDNIWTYYYVRDLSSGNVAQTGYDNITLTERPDHKTADMYAYFPYNQSAYSGGPTAIPYEMNNSITGQQDLMYAHENTTGTNADLDPEGGSPLSAHFSFQHAFAALRFRFKLRNADGYYRLRNIICTINDPDSDGITTAKLYSRGTFNAVTGEFNDGGTEVRSYYISFETVVVAINSTSSYATATLLLVPTALEDDELKVSFSISGQSTPPFYIKKEYVKHSDGSTYGLKSGYVYTFNFELDNYLYLDGFNVSEDWTDDVTLGREDI